MVTELPSVISLKSVTITVIDKEKASKELFLHKKTRHFLPNFSTVTEMEQNPQIANSTYVWKTMKNVKQPN